MNLLFSQARDVLQQRHDDLSSRLSNAHEVSAKAAAKLGYEKNSLDLDASKVLSEHQTCMAQIRGHGEQVQGETKRMIEVYETELKGLTLQRDSSSAQYSQISNDVKILSKKLSEVVSLVNGGLQQMCVDYSAEVQMLSLPVAPGRGLREPARFMEPVWARGVGGG